MANQEDSGEALQTLTRLRQLPAQERRAIVAGLAENAQPSWTDAFAEILKAEDDPLCRWYAIRALGDLRAGQHADLLVAVLRSPDAKVGVSSLHKIAASSIGRLGAGLSSKVLPLLDSNDAQTQLAAIDALGELRDPAVTEALARCLRFPSREHRLWAALSLSKIGEPALLSLAQAISEGDGELVLTCLDALLMIDSPTVIDIAAVAVQKQPEACKRYFCENMLPRAKEFLLKLHCQADASGPKSGLAARILRDLELR